MRSILVVLVLVFLLHPAPAALAGGPELQTRATLLVGFPGDEAPEGLGVLVVPGTVIPVEEELAPAVNDEQHNRRIRRVADQLTRTFRLHRIDVAFSQPVDLDLDRSVELPPPSLTSGLRIHLELLGFDDQQATYQVRFVDGQETLATTRAFLSRGRLGVVGGVDGPEAPYAFLVLEPQPLVEDGGPFRVEGDIQHPRAVHKVAPSYTEEALKKRTQGVVILQTVIDREGRVEDVKVLKGQPHGLSEAAVGAVRQWTFEPARDKDGNPVSVYYNLTINFRLDDEENDEIENR